MALTGSDFVAAYANKGYGAWERAAVDMVRSGSGLVDWPWAPLRLSDGVNTVDLRVRSDYLAVGTPEDYVRLPLTPRAAQEIANLRGSTLPTPWLDYQIWKAAPVKLDRRAMAPNRGANLAQYADHSRLIDAQIAEQGGANGRLVAGHKKDVVVSRLLRPGKVIIHGWYHPRTDVFDDRRAWNDPSPDKQPQQALSDAHGADYVDYSHGIREVDENVLVNGTPRRIDDALRDPAIAKLLSHEGPLTVTRYDAPSSPGVAVTQVRLADAGLRSFFEDDRVVLIGPGGIVRTTREAA